MSALQDSWSPEEKSNVRRSESVQQLGEDDEEEEVEMHSRDDQHLLERLRQEKQKMLEKFQEHEQDLARLNNKLTQV